MHIRAVTQRLTLLYKILLAVVVILFSVAQAEMPLASVVKISAGGSSGTGFVWQGQKGTKYIVTSLHTLAGASKIFYNVPGFDTQLKVYRFDKESDLALLVPMNSPLDLPALNLGNPTPNQNAQYEIFGFPAGIKLVQGDSIEFSKAQHNVSMAELLPNDVVGEVTASGFPQASLKVLRVSSGITPGHSGAPIVDSKTNEVIGIGAGGLSKQGFRRVNWAVPALSYLNDIEANGADSGFDNLTTSGGNVNKFSVSVASTPVESEGANTTTEGNSESPQNSEALNAYASITAGENKYYKVYQVPLDELFNSLNATSSEPIVSEETVNSITEQAQTLGFEISDALIDIYQNLETGAMIYLPNGVEISVENEVLVASFDDGLIQLYLQIEKTDSFASAQNKEAAFNDLIIEELDFDWVADFETVEVDEDGEGFWTYFSSDDGTDDDTEYSDKHFYLYEDITFNDSEGYGDFFGSLVVANEISDFDDEELLVLEVINLLGLLSGF